MRPLYEIEWDESSSLFPITASEDVAIAQGDVLNKTLRKKRLCLD